MADQSEKRLWYIVQTYSGKEDSVRDNLISRITSMDMEGQIFQVIIPEDTIQETLKDGTAKEKIVKRFPGYVFVEMIDNDNSWYVVRNTPGVTGFLGSSGKKARPIPVSNEEMEPILKQCGLLKEKEINFHVGDSVTVIAGNWKDQIGVVEAIDMDKREVAISLELFGRTVDMTVAVDEVEAVK